MTTAAERLAHALLASSGDRWRHTQAVARRAAALAEGLDGADREALITAAWLHDIGYAPELAITGFHPLDGARYLGAEGYPPRLCALVAHHTGARFEAEERGLSAQLAAYPREDSPVMDALTTADLTTGPQGQPLTLDQRLTEILTRYPPATPVHRGITRARPDLTAAVHRSRASYPT